MSNAIARDELFRDLQVASSHPFRSINHRSPLEHAAGLNASCRLLAAWLWAEALDEALVSAPLSAYTKHTMTQANDILRDLTHIRERGWATDDQEYSVGLFYLAAPGYDRSGNVVAAISASTLASLVNADNLNGLPERVMDSAWEISAKLGWYKPPSETSHTANDFTD